MNQLETNIIQAIKSARRDGVTAMSLANLKQVTSTNGLTISVAEYHNSFNEVADKVATRLKFKLIKGGDA